MFRKGRRGLTAAILAGLLLAPLGAAEAAGTARSEPDGPWVRLAGWLWEQAGGVIAVWAAGSSIDPFGKPQDSSAQTDAGSDIDPNGKPQDSSAQTNAGPEIDPFGKPQTNSAQTDAGSSIDPNG